MIRLAFLFLLLLQTAGWASPQPILQLDNQTAISSDALLIDPFPLLRTKVGGAKAPFDVIAAYKKMSQYTYISPENFPEWDGSTTIPKAADAAGTKEHFVGHFCLDLPDEAKNVWWQISHDPSFAFIVSNLNQLQSAVSAVELDPLTQTFLNPDTAYYFRYQYETNDGWSGWSSPLCFVAKKPTSVTAVTFEKTLKGDYVIQWDYPDDPTVQFHVFGSNALDSIPPLYFDQEINLLFEGEVIESSPNMSTHSITKEKSLVVDGSYAYYRIIAEKEGRLSVPSSIVYVYDQELSHPRTILQAVDEETALRLPLIGYCDQRYVRDPTIPKAVWDRVRPYFIPENHPIKPILDRLFKKSRATYSHFTLEKAGFTFPEVQGLHVVSAFHKKIKEYIVKLYLDRDHNTLEWEQWVKRITGASLIRRELIRNKYEPLLKVPQKWIYPLPTKPRPRGEVKRLHPFILVAVHMHPLTRQKSHRRYQTKTKTQLLDAVYKVVSKLGLKDALNVDNLPWCEDGRLAFIDTKNYNEENFSFSPIKGVLNQKMRAYWNKIVREGEKRRNRLN